MILDNFVEEGQEETGNWEEGVINKIPTSAIVVTRRNREKVFALRDILHEAPRGSRGILTKFNMGRLLPEVQPPTLLYTILAEEVWYSFTNVLKYFN